MAGHRIFTTAFSSVYPLYVQKAERKGRSQNEVDQVIRWLTGYDQAGLEANIRQNSDFETFFAQAPAIHPNAALIKGVVCGVRVEDVPDPLMQKIRYLVGPAKFTQPPRPSDLRRSSLPSVPLSALRPTWRAAQIAAQKGP